MLRAYALRILAAILVVVSLCLTVQCVRVGRLKTDATELKTKLSGVEGELRGTKAGLKAVETVEANQKHRVEILTRNISDVRSQPVTSDCVRSPAVSVALDRLRQGQLAAGSGKPADVQVGSPGSRP